MAKKKHSAGKVIALAAITGAVAGCVSYFLRYKSFHKELEEDFHDFEGDDDFDGQLPHENECCCKTMGEKACEAGKNALDTAKAMAEDALEEAAEAAADKAEDLAEAASDKAEKAAEAAVQMAQDTVEAAAETAKDVTDAIKEKATTIVEEDKEA